LSALDARVELGRPADSAALALAGSGARAEAGAAAAATLPVVFGLPAGGDRPVRPRGWATRARG
jgi:hypothetical protein